MKQESISINLSSILNLSAKLNNSVDVNLILNSTLLSMMGKLGISRAAVFKNNNQKFEIIIQKGKCEIKEVDFFEIDEFREINIYNESENSLVKCDYKYIIPINVAGKLDYLFVLGKSLVNKELDQSEIEYINLLTNIASISLQNAENFQDLDIQKQKAERKNILLENLFQNARYFFSYFQSEDIINLLSYNLMGQLLINKLALVLIDDDGETYIAKNKFNVELNQKIIDYSISIKNLQQVDEIENLNIKSILKEMDVNLISPLYFKNKIRGAIFVGNSMSKKELSDEDLLFIDYLGNTAIAALENERLFQEELKKKQLESELNLALEIQKGLFPSEAIEIENYSIYGRSIPSKQVGGDYYDHIQIDENRYFILIADVSGKGMPAAMIMANLQAALRVLVKLGLPLLDIIINLNHIVYSNTSQDKFVTFFGGILDTKKNTFEYINAGHNPPYLFRDGKVINLDKGGLFLGLMDGGFPYESEEIKLEDNDFIILYTDGITEAMNTKNEEFGDDNLIDICQKNTSRLELLDDIIEKVKLFSYGSSQYDDITMLALVRK